MPLRKYRSVAEMRSPDWSPPLDPENLRRAGRVSAFVAGLSPRRFPPGLYKYRSAEDAAEARERWEIEDVAPPPSRPRS